MMKLRYDIDNKKYEDRSFDAKNGKDQDEILQKKNKDIYELTVQLGCLKEENF